MNIKIELKDTATLSRIEELSDVLLGKDSDDGYDFSDVIAGISLEGKS